MRADVYSGRGLPGSLTAAFLWRARVEVALGERGLRFAFGWSAPGTGAAPCDAAACGVGLGAKKRSRFRER